MMIDKRDPQGSLFYCEVKEEKRHDYRSILKSGFYVL